MSLICYRISIIFAMIVIGFVCSKTKMLPFESNKYLIMLIMNITSPCLLITSIAGKELTDSTIAATVQMLAASLIYFIAGMFAAVGLAKLIRAPKEDTGLYSMIITCRNTGFMGFPVTKAAYGNDGLFMIVLNNIIMNMYIYSAGILQMNIGGRRERLDLKQTLRSMANMCSFAALAGIILLFTGIKIPSFINDLITPIGDATIPVSMLVLGIQLAESDLKKAMLNRKLLLVTFISLIIWPVVTFLAVNWLPLDVYVKAMLVYASAFPTMVMIVVIAASEKKNTQFAAEAVALTTMFSVITLPAATVLLTMYYGI